MTAQTSSGYHTPDGKFFSELDQAVRHMEMLNLRDSMEEKFKGAKADYIPFGAIASWLIQNYDMEPKK